MISASGLLNNSSNGLLFYISRRVDNYFASPDGVWATWIVGKDGLKSTYGQKFYSGCNRPVEIIASADFTIEAPVKLGAVNSQVAALTLDPTGHVITVTSKIYGDGSILVCGHGDVAFAEGATLEVKGTAQKAPVAVINSSCLLFENGSKVVMNTELILTELINNESGAVCIVDVADQGQLSIGNEVHFKLKIGNSTINMGDISSSVNVSVSGQALWFWLEQDNDGCLWLRWGRNQP